VGFVFVQSGVGRENRESLDLTDEKKGFINYFPTLRLKVM
jgi:hypothetical protein